MVLVMMWTLFFGKKDYFKSFIRKQEEKVFIDSQMVVGL